MNLYDDVLRVVYAALDRLVADGTLPADLERGRVAVETPRDPTHGDMATNAAMVLAKAAGQKPRDLATALLPHLLADPLIATASIAGPGFINLQLPESAWHTALQAALQAGPAYGDSRLGAGQVVNVEYVSTNPTGPIHAGHVRGAIYGDALANLLLKTGHQVIREYYVNDAGGQVDTLARSVHLRYREALGEEIGPIPEGFYPGDYLKPVGAALAEAEGDRWRDAPEASWLPLFRRHAVAMMMDQIKQDLAALGIAHDVFSSEAALVEAGAVDAAVAAMEEKGLIYRGILEPPKGKTPEDWEPREQTLFRASDFGDDTDRPIRKSDGSWTYFASDIAYHDDKIRRGATQLIDVMGADHGGYVARMQAAVAALSDGKVPLDIKLCQLVKMLDAGQPVKLSKRAGTIITAAEIIAAVGRDVLRFIMLTRKNDQALEFDFAKVKEQSKDNPVFYVQYAHARCCSVLRHAADLLPGIALEPASLADAALQRLDSADDKVLIRLICSWPRLVEQAAQSQEPHRIAFYLYDLASAFHHAWTHGRDDATLRFLLPDDPELTRARLALVSGVATVIASGLAVMGVTPVEEM